MPSLAPSCAAWCFRPVGGLVGVLLAIAACGAAEASELRFNAIVKAVERVRPSVVNIHGRKVLPSGQSLDASASKQVNGMGTGVVIDERGYILTNYHVVENVSRIQVTLHDKQTLTAKLVVNDPKTDLAVIKIESSARLMLAPLGASHDLMPGETVMAVGNAYGYEHTVSQGIISALHRTVQVSDEQTYHDLIQTDASINPGNSGGPLINIDGEVIGVNVAVRVGAQGIGFAIPIDQVKEVAAQLISAESLAGVRHGVTGRMTLEGGQSRYVVDSVRDEGPAETAGLRPGDVIERASGRSVVNRLDFERAFLDVKPGDDVPLVIRRDGESLDLALTVQSSLGQRSQAALDRAWSLLGMRLDPIPNDSFKRNGSRFRGGLRVLEVKSGSPAASQQIRPGDVLVGMHIWETITPENVAYILNRAESEKIAPVIFYIMRGEETLYGHINLASRGRLDK